MATSFTGTRYAVRLEEACEGKEPLGSHYLLLLVIRMCRRRLLAYPPFFHIGRDHTTVCELASLIARCCHLYQS